MDSIYLDFAATTPLDERVLEEMLPYMTQNFGNASSTHHLGQQAKVKVEEAREKIAALINAEPAEIVFTSGGTESDNAAIRGAMLAHPQKKEIISSPIEHHAVLTPVESAEINGFRHRFIHPDQHGNISISELEKLLSDNTALLSLMHVNNETGTINDLAKIAQLAKDKNVLFHTDAVQSLGKIPLNVKESGIDLMSASAHKIYGPKGVGMLYVKSGANWEPWLTGGSQERRRRGGTTNVPGVIGFAKALELAIEEMEVNLSHYRKLRKLLLSQLDDKLSNCTYFINGESEHSVDHIINLAFLNENDQGIDGEMLLLNLDIEGICVSNGSACTSGAVEPSHVLLGIGINEKRANSSIRISFGKSTTEQEIIQFVDRLNSILTRMFELV